MALSPAEYVIRVFGGVRATARAIGRSPASVSKWRARKNLNGTGGRIPGPAQMAILEVAYNRRLDITANDVLYGRAVPRNLDKRIRA